MKILLKHSTSQRLQMSHFRLEASKWDLHKHDPELANANPVCPQQMSQMWALTSQLRSSQHASQCCKCNETPRKWEVPYDSQPLQKQFRVQYCGPSQIRALPRKCEVCSASKTEASPIYFEIKIKTQLLPLSPHTKHPQKYINLILTRSRDRNIKITYKTTKRTPKRIMQALKQKNLKPSRNETKLGIQVINDKVYLYQVPECRAP